MKERIYKIVIALVLLAGFLTIMSLIKLFAPDWVTWSLLGIILVYILYDVSKPDKKPKDKYYYYTYVISEYGRTSMGYGIQHSEVGEFDFKGYYGNEIYRTCNITMTQEISKEQYIALQEIINKPKTESEKKYDYDK